MRLLLTLIFSCLTVNSFAQEKVSTPNVTGIVVNEINDAQTGKMRLPSVNRAVFVFDGVYKTLGVGNAANKVIKTDRLGRFSLSLEPGIYTFAILINGKYVTIKRKDGYCSFIDCLNTEKCSVELIDRSKNSEDLYR